MPGRTLLFVGILIMAFVGPYLLSQQGPIRSSADPGQSTATGDDSTWWQGLTSRFGGSDVVKSSEAASTETVPVNVNDGLPGRPVPAQQLGGPAGVSIADALRFEANPNWVSRNWQRVTTQLSDPDYHGLRVPLVTGTEAHDLAGSLSFYFNAQNQCERIRFFGYTGDFEPLASLVQARFGMRQFASVGPGLYLSFVGPRPVGVLRIEDAAVQVADRPRSRYRVVLEVNLPRQDATLSEEMLAKLQSLREAKML